MDAATTRLITEADYLVKRAAWCAELGIPAEAHAAGRCTKCGGWIFVMTADTDPPGNVPAGGCV